MTYRHKFLKFQNPDNYRVYLANHGGLSKFAKIFKVHLATTRRLAEVNSSSSTNGCERMKRLKCLWENKMLEISSQNVSMKNSWKLVT